MCHRPAYRRPKVPLKLKHVSFSKFFHVLYDPSPTGDELQELRVASDELGGVLNSHPKSQKELADTLMPVWRTILPNSGERLWRRGVRIKGDRGFVEDLYCEQDGTPHVVICCRVDPGSSGDSYMRLCRLYDTYVRSDPKILSSTAPCFLISISGPDIKICGGFTERNPTQVEVDQFKTVSASLDRAVNRREYLAKLLFALRCAVEYLPTNHLFDASERVPSVPVVFDTFIGEDKRIHSLVFGRPFNKSRCSIYYTATPADCMVKLTFRPYGSDVHKILHAADLAPKLVGASNIPALGATATVMVNLPPPTEDADGWMTLHDLFRVSPELVLNHQDAIFKKLELIVEVLKKQKVVHGDLRANNIMIKVSYKGKGIAEPVEVNVVDMEWSGGVGFAYYPADRNEKVGYPGEAGGVIGVEDDIIMIKMWKQGINRHSHH
ncbi:hypothetical protein GALMADRAFT_149228 [Galerina marginata CBS 339.88]|uniref:Uncharacterized protein n=1 Tax=Galerina marginata (strain CBS 339.88) TaxID=685588 RepID=A0A067S240_GALM3|nr:hypothetical protein GALMADRAFT_149228 [Galerina marginata CBS 339.88]